VSHTGEVALTGIIYTITNQIPSEKGIQKVYVGQTTTPLEKRWKGHLRDARRGVDTYLYSALRKYGENNFTIVARRKRVFEDEAGRRKWLDASEARLIKKLKARQTDFGYNLKDGGYHGAHHPETPAKIGAAVRRSFIEHPERRVRQAEIARAQQAEPERAALFQEGVRRFRADPVRWEAAAPKRREASRLGLVARRADPTCSPRLKASLRAVWADPEYKQMMKAKFKAAGADPARRAAIKARKKEQWKDPEFKEGMKTKLRVAWAEDPTRHADQSEVMKRQWEDPVFREKAVVARRLRQADPASRAAFGSKIKALWADPEYKARVGAAISAGHARRRQKAQER
jgi:hypothetical protein